MFLCVVLYFDPFETAFNEDWLNSFGASFVVDMKKHFFFNKKDDPLYVFCTVYSSGKIQKS